MSNASIPDHVWTVLCRKRILEAQTNKVSLIDIPERLSLPRQKIEEAEEQAADNRNVVIPFECSLVSMFWRDRPAGKWDYRIDVKAPDGKTRPQDPIDIPANDQPGSHRVFFDFGALTFHGIGTYYFNVRMKADGAKRWKRVARIPFQIAVQEE